MFDQISSVHMQSSHLFLLLSFLALELWLIAKTTILTTIPANSKHTHLISNNLTKRTTLLPLLVTRITSIITLVTMTMTRMLIGTPSPQNHIRAIPTHKPTFIPMRCPKSTSPLHLKCRTRDMHKVHIPYKNHSNTLHVRKCMEMAPLAGLSLERNS